MVDMASLRHWFLCVFMPLYLAYFSRFNNTMANPVLSTKLFIPPTRPKLVSRAHLVEKVSLNLQHKLTLIVAPAGFGKSTLASEVVAGNNLSACWLSLDESDGDTNQFLSCFIAALHTLYPELANSLLSELQGASAPPAETVLSELLNLIASETEAFIFVLDDYHALESQAVDALLNIMLEYMPPQLHLVITSREDPALPLARLRARGQLTELRAADLRFSESEAAIFLNQTMGLNLGQADIHALENRTEGWIAGLQLAALSLQHQKDASNYIHHFSGSHHFVLDYLLEEALQQQTEEIQTFLLHTSILKNLNASLCAEVMGVAERQAETRISEIERANLFIIPLDHKRECYRYHHLFSDVLRSRLNNLYPDRIQSLHQKASAWFEESGAIQEAISHAFKADDTNRVADLIEIAWPDADRYIDSAPWLGWLKALPDCVFTSRPILQNIYVWALLDTGNMEEAQTRLETLASWTEAHQKADALPEPPPSGVIIVDSRQYQRLLASISSARGYMAQTHGDIQAAIKHNRRTCELYPDKDDIDYITADGMLALAYIAAGELDQAYAIFLSTAEKLKKHTRADFAIGASLILTDLKLVLGQLYNTDALISQFSQLLPGRRPYPQGAVYLYIAQAKLAIAWFHLGDAEQAIAQAEDVDKDSPLVLARYRLTMVKAWFQQAKGNWQMSLELLKQAEKLYYRNVVPEFLPIGAQKVRAQIKLGRLNEAWHWVNENKLNFQDEVSFLREFEYLTLARLLITTAEEKEHSHYLCEAISLLDRLINIFRKNKRNQFLIEALILASICQQHRTDITSAFTIFSQALDLAQPEDHIIPFVLEGRQLLPLLQQARKQSIQLHFVDRILHTLTTASSSSGSSEKSFGSQCLVDSLSKREKQILKLIAEGLSNQEISEKLFLALSSVKGHNQKIFSKLQVQRRTEAVARARELELL